MITPVLPLEEDGPASLLDPNAAPDNYYLTTPNGFDPQTVGLPFFDIESNPTPSHSGPSSGPSPQVLIFQPPQQPTDFGSWPANSLYQPLTAGNNRIYEDCQGNRQKYWSFVYEALLTLQRNYGELALLATQPNEEPKYQCAICVKQPESAGPRRDPLSMHRRWDLSPHILGHAVVPIRPWFCDKCPRSYLRKHDLNRHQVDCNGIPPRPRRRYHSTSAATAPFPFPPHPPVTSSWTDTTTGLPSIPPPVVSAYMPNSFTGWAYSPDLDPTENEVDTSRPPYPSNASEPSSPPPRLLSFGEYQHSRGVDLQGNHDVFITQYGMGLGFPSSVSTIRRVKGEPSSRLSPQYPPTAEEVSEKVAMLESGVWESKDSIPSAQGLPLRACNTYKRQILAVLLALMLVSVGF
ncbi:hypothetical protein FRC17_001959, partial [Serendipita sp. 399]